MALKTFVKISTVNNLSDARYCAGMYVNLMGFNLEENNKNYLAPGTFNELTEWLSGLEYVGEFENTHPDTILETLKAYEGISFVQINEEAYLQMLLNTSFKLIWKPSLKSKQDLQQLIAKSSGLQENGITLLLESEELDLDNEVVKLIQKLAGQCAVLLGFGLKAEQIEETLAATGVKGIALQGGDEIKPGYKDFDELADILEALEVVD